MEIKRRKGTIFLNSILLLSVAIMVVGYSNSYIVEQIRDYQQLDKIYKQQINKIYSKSNKINYCEYRNP